MPISARRSSGPLLGAIERNGENVRWEKAHVRSATFDKMQVDPEKAVDARFQGSFMAPTLDAYDNVMQNVVEGMFERDGIISGDSQEKRDEEYAALLANYNRQKLVVEALRDQYHAESDEPLEAAEERLNAMLEQMLSFDTVRVVPPILSEEQRDAEQPHKQHNFTHILNRVHLCYEKKQAQFLNALRQPSLIDQVVNPVESTKSQMTGRERLNIIREILDSFGIERSEMQKSFHEDMIGACAKLIFGPDLLAELDDLLLELGVDELIQQFMAITPRRMGKTYSVAMFVVALLFGIEGIEQAIFSTGRRASQKLIELIFRFLCKIPGMRESIVKHNVETIWIQGPYGEDDIRKVFSYPSNVRISLFCRFVWFPVSSPCSSLSLHFLSTFLAGIGYWTRRVERRRRRQWHQSDANRVRQR